MDGRACVRLVGVILTFAGPKDEPLALLHFLRRKPIEVTQLVRNIAIARVCRIGDSILVEIAVSNHFEEHILFRSVALLVDRQDFQVHDVASRVGTEAFASAAATV